MLKRAAKLVLFHRAPAQKSCAKLRKLRRSKVARSMIRVVSTRVGSQADRSAWASRTAVNLLIGREKTVLVSMNRHHLVDFRL